MVKSDKWIKKMALEKKMIEPFAEQQVRQNNISYGTSSYGYDMRISGEFKIMQKKSDGSFIDPKKIDENLFLSVHVDDFIILQPQTVALARTVEYFKIPRDVVTIAFGKSTYARCGILVNITPFEPEWEGFATLAISNISSLPVKIYANEGIAQLLFLGADEVCEISYADRAGKYQAQKTITSAKV
ncbi:MAG: dCTP deaminase [Endomicrobiaceae bacterium]|nr:dCTP deaminase [Endomicrobiaceae bacterium]